MRRRCRQQPSTSTAYPGVRTPVKNAAATKTSFLFLFFFSREQLRGPAMSLTRKERISWRQRRAQGREDARWNTKTEWFQESRCPPFGKPGKTRLADTTVQGKTSPRAHKPESRVRMCGGTSEPSVHACRPERKCEPRPQKTRTIGALI